MTPLLLALALSTPSLDDRPASALDGRDDRGSVLHPDIPLRDRDGALLRDSGGVLHFGQTCGGCHDVGYIEDHAYHLRPGESAGGAPPPRSRYDEGRGLAARFAPLVYGDPRGGLGRDPAAAHRALGPRAAGDAPSAELNCLSCHGIEDGWIVLSDRPGLGFDFDQEKLDAHPVTQRQDLNVWGRRQGAGLYIAGLDEPRRRPTI